MEKIRFGLIGCGGMMKSHASIINLLEDQLEITAVCDKPLVLHGGSGTPDDQMQNAIRHGITKINIYSDVVGAMNQGLKEKLNTLENPSAWPYLVFADARQNMKDVVKAKLHTFGSAGRA